jgi:hypothetical protein
MSLQMPEMGGMMPPQQPLPQGLQEPGEAPDKEDPLDVLQECIQALPGLLNALPDPQDVQDATQALLILSRIQTRLMSKQQSSGPQS